MNKYDLKIYDRISELITLLLNPDFESNILNISKATGTSLSQTRVDLKNMHSAGIKIWPEETVEKLSASDPAFDEEEFELEVDRLIDDNLDSPYLMIMNPLEKVLFENGKLKGFDIKDSPLSIPPKVLDRKSVIEQAIQEGLCIRFRYPGQDNSQAETLEIAPRMIFHNTTDDLLYCLSFNEDEMISAFRLDRMLYDVKIVKSKPIPFISEDLPQFQRLKYVWGSDFNNTENPVHVRIRISPDTPNILRKIRADISGRVYAKLYQEDSYWIYEDDIIGEASFRSWLMLFGSSVKVLEPDHIAKRILESSKMRLNNYAENTFCEYDQPV